MIGKELSVAAQFLEQGELVAIPTETVYGLAANALDPNAVAKVFEAKHRPHFNPLIVHIANADEAHKYVSAFPEKAKALAAKFWPGPLSLLLPKKDSIPSIVTAGLDSVVVRVPAHQLTLALLNSLDFPLAAPSANSYQSISPTNPYHVQKSLGKNVKYILDGGNSTVGVESTIISFLNNDITLLRHGGIPIEEIAEITGRIAIQTNGNAKQVSPGQAEKHYASKKPLYLTKDINSLILKHAHRQISLLFHGEDIFLDTFKKYNLSKSSNPLEAATNLFDYLHQADEDTSDIIIALQFENQGLGYALNDRLFRASVK